MVVVEIFGVEALNRLRRGRGRIIVGASAAAAAVAVAQRISAARRRAFERR
jgi:hypothetical protein